MISANDTTILAALSRYPDMPAEEADSHIERIEHEENVAICHAVLGRIDPRDLPEDSQRVYREFHLWSQNRTRRIHNEQQIARYRERETRMAQRMRELHERGVVSDETLLLYGISGDMPERHVYIRMSEEEKRMLWIERMERRLGPNWTHRVNRLPTFVRQLLKEYSVSREDWMREGF